MGTESGAGLADKGAAAARGRPRGKRPQVASGRVRRTRSAPTAPQAGFGNRALRPQPPRFSERWAAVWTRLYPASGPDASPLIRGKTRPGRSAPTAPQRPRPLLSARLGRAPGEPRRGAAGRVRGGRAHRASVRGAGLRSRAAPAALSGERAGEHQACGRWQPPGQADGKTHQALFILKLTTLCFLRAFVLIGSDDNVSVSVTLRFIIILVAEEAAFSPIVHFIYFF